MPEELGLIRESTLMFASEEVAQLTELDSKLVVVFFFLDLHAQFVHALAFFGRHGFLPWRVGWDVWQNVEGWYPKPGKETRAGPRG
jgi:hypothetical protein